MAPNHGGEPLGSILGPMGSHWGEKMGQKVKKLPCPKIRIFDYAVIDFAKNRIYSYGAKSRWRIPRVHLGVNGVPFGPKMSQNRKKLPCPIIRIFYYSAVIDLGKKSNLPLWCQITVVTPYGPSILGPMGSHYGHIMGQNRKKLPCPKIRILITPRSSIWAKNRIYGYGAKSRWGTPRVNLRANGVPLGQKKWVETVNNYHAPKFGFWLLRGHRFVQKMKLTVMTPNHGGDALESILGPMASDWDQKRGQNRKKLPCPKIRIFDYSAVIDLGKKSN